MRIGVYAGSFDPITRGHEDIIRRSLHVLDKLVVLILNNPRKQYWFSMKEREEMIRASLGEDIQDRISITTYEGLLVDFLKGEEISILVRGLRAVSDYEYEMGYALANKDLSKGKVETIFIPASREYMYLSSSGVREIAIHQGDISYYVSPVLENRIRERAKDLVK